MSSTAVNVGTSEPEGKRAVIEKNLWRWNLAMGMLHLIQGIIVLAASQSLPNAKKYTIPMYTFLPAWERGFPTVSAQFRGSFPFAGVTSGFAFMSAAAHFIVLGCWQKYLADLRNNINVFRWYEYAVSSSLMIVLIAMLFGMWDPISLTLLASVNCCMNLFGLLHERLNQGRSAAGVNWEAFAFGCFAGLVPWCAIFAYIIASPSLDRVPGFVWAILATYVFFFNTFPINSPWGLARAWLALALAADSHAPPPSVHTLAHAFSPPLSVPAVPQVWLVE